MWARTQAAPLVAPAKPRHDRQGAGPLNFLIITERYQFLSLCMSPFRAVSFNHPRATFHHSSSDTTRYPTKSLLDSGGELCVLRRSREEKLWPIHRELQLVEEQQLFGWKTNRQLSDQTTLKPNLERTSLKGTTPKDRQEDEEKLSLSFLFALRRGWKMRVCLTRSNLSLVDWAFEGGVHTV